MSDSNTALLTYEYRLYPRRSELRCLEAMLEQGCEVYNTALAQCKIVYETQDKHQRALDQWSYFREWRKQPSSLLNASSLQHLLRRLDKAYSAFFRRIKNGETPGHPRFKSRDRFNSLEYTYGDGCKLVDDGKRMLLYLQKVGSLKVKFHRPLPVSANIKHLILKRKASGWYVYLQMEIPQREVQPSDKPPVGVDVGLLRLLTFSDGTQVDNPRWLRASLAQLRRAQRRLARRHKGSRRRDKARQQVALLHEHVANTRKDFWHKTTHTLTHTYGAIALEDLHLAFMLQNGHLSLSAHDAGLGMFYTLLDSKAENAGCRIVRVDPAYTSQVCSRCGVLVEKDLSVRVHACPHCSLVLDRDENAARNIFNLAFKSAWTEPSGVNAVGCHKRSLRSTSL